MPTTLDAVDNTGFPDVTNTILDNDPSYASGLNGAGVFCDYMEEPIPKYIRAGGEWVQNKGNSWIVLGRDRPGSRSSGYGGQGHTQASSIDLCVGRGSPVPSSSDNLDPNFGADAARIYISQKANIDQYFGTIGSKSKLKSTALSGIGIKADAVRIIGNEGVKIVTRPSGINSKNGQIDPNGIELIANNDDSDMQPMVKGDNLVEAFNALEENLNQLSAVLLNFLKSQNEFNLQVAAHTHFGTGAGATGPVPVTTFPAPTLPSAATTAAIDHAEGMLDNFKFRINTNILWNTKYLSPNSKKYILSKYNKVN